MDKCGARFSEKAAYFYNLVLYFNQQNHIPEI
jgi:hypothetical protein